MLLYIEDNPAIAENVLAYLETESFNVTWLADGEEGLQAALDGYYDCIILDVMLPGKDGFAICKEVRKHKQVPIIMTTARGELDDKGE
jgi:DNA-binding response OmpR family regulator